MRRTNHPILPLLLGLAATSVFAQSAFELSVQKRGRDTASGVAVLVAAESGKPALLLTSASLIEGGSTTQYVVSEAGGAQFLATLEEQDAEENFALFSVPGLAGEPVTVATAASDAGRQARLLLPAGPPQNGQVHSTVVRNGQTFHRFTFSVSPSQSGAPILNNCDELLSVHYPQPRRWNRNDRPFSLGRELVAVERFLLNAKVPFAVAAEGCRSVEEQLELARQEQDDLEAQKAELEEQADELARQAEEAAQQSEEAAREAETAAQEVAAEKSRLEEQLAAQAEELELRETELEQKQALEEEQQRELEATEEARVEAETEAEAKSRQLQYTVAAATAALLIGGLGAWAALRSRRRRHQRSNEELVATQEELARQNTTFPDLVLAGQDGAGNEVRVKINGSAVARAGQEGQVLGRSSANADYVLAAEGVSRRHARLYVAADTLYLEDLGSTNGTRVDGHDATQGRPVPVTNSSSVILGDVALVAYFLSDAS